jgi:hypothetical protein
MKAFETATTVESDQAIHLAGLPFAAGTQVDVVVIPRLSPAEFKARWNDVCWLLRTSPGNPAPDDAELERDVRDDRAGR